MIKKRHHSHHDYEKESADYYDQVAVKFDKSWDGFLSGFFKRYIAKNLQLPKNARVLDVGCANGQLLALLAQKGVIHGSGLDISPQMIKIARARHPEFYFERGSAQKLPFENKSFDILVCSASFHHFPQPHGFLEEAKRVLDENGRLVIAEIRLPFLTDAYNRRLQKHSTEGDVRVYRPYELRKLFEEAGFKLVVAKKHFQIQYYELRRERL